MYILMCLGITILLVLIQSVLAYYSQQLYVRYYQRHIAFEPTQLYSVSTTQLLQGFIINLIAFCFPFVLMYLFGDQVKPDTVHHICGLVVIYLAYFVSRLAMSILFYLYIKKNPQYINGSVTFQAPAVKMLNIAIIVQYAIFLAIIAFFVPSSFILGGLAGLILAGLISYFSKQVQANV